MREGVGGDGKIRGDGGKWEESGKAGERVREKESYISTPVC